ncbi:MAG: hypothetical protein CMG75_00745 [Candidatus Marinimicrobia bacterium]|nr:hypothetical protein [Candidatus Neomarinimicrobiota bacterium]|tara:strand:- start:3534 stop:3875 length:342 start_codon:yes stop_codon:yes gene_type:complete
MKKIAIIIDDFQLATKIVDAVGYLGGESIFPDQNKNLQWKADLIIVDLDCEKNTGFNQIKKYLKSQADVNIIGCAKRVSKSLRKEAITAGCKMVLTKSSLSRNISSLLMGFNS